MENLIWGLVAVAIAATMSIPIVVHIVLSHIRSTLTVGGQPVELIRQQTMIGYMQSRDEQDAQRELASAMRRDEIGE